MAFKLIHLCLVFVLVVWQRSSAMRIQIDTVKYNGVIPESFNINCYPDRAAGGCIERLLAIQVHKDNARPMATLVQSSDVIYDKLLAPNIKAIGHIDRDPTKSNLTVTFSGVLKEDSGQYVCTLLYFDSSGLLQQDTASENYTVDSSQNTHDVIRHLMATFSSMESLTKRQQDEMDDMKSKISQQQNETNALREESKTLKDQLNEQHDETNTLRNRLVKQEIEFQILKKETNQYILKESVQSIFTAGYMPSDLFQTNKVAPFRKELLNIGQDYDTETSVYTAPRNGTYIFYVTVMTNNRVNYLNIDVRVNGVFVARLFVKDDSTYDQSSITAIVNLEAGDTVDCYLLNMTPASQTMYAYPYTTFSGHLVKAT